MNKKSFKLRIALKSGLWGIGVSFLWLLFYIIIMGLSHGDSGLREVVRRINLPFAYVVDTLIELSSTSADNIPVGCFIILVVYLTTGYVLGFFFYVIRQTFLKNKTFSDKSDKDSR